MNALKAYRKAHGLTLGEVASRIGGVSVGSLSRIESGEQWPSAELARRIVAMTDGDVTPNDLLAIGSTARRFSKKPVQTSVRLELDEVLLAKAEAEGVDLAVTIEAAVRAELATIRAERWRRENAEAIKAMADRIATEGVAGEEYRSFG